MTVPYEGKSDGTTGAPVTQPAPSTEAAPSVPDSIDLGEGVGSVSLDEARKGYLRQSDYTRKTQQLSQERENLAVAAQLAQALDASPAETLRALAEAYGVPIGQAEDSLDGDEEEIPPHIAARLQEMESELAESRQFRQTSEEREVEQIIDQQLEEVGRQAQQLGLEVDEEELIEFALANELNDLPAAFLKMHQGRLLPPSTDLKRRLPGSRSGALSNSVRSTKPEAGHMSLEQALEAAMSEHGVSNLNDLDLD